MTITFKSKLEKPCLLWAGCTNEAGYGMRWYAPTGKAEKVHRVAYAEHHGLSMAEIKGVVIRHRCDTPLCYEPTHLLAGTQLDNISDMVARQRHPRGEQSNLSVLTTDQVREIKRRLGNGQLRSIVAADFHVSVYTIRDIAQGKAWRHV